MPYMEAPAGYAVGPGQQVEVTFRTGIFGVGSFGPPVWLVEQALEFTQWEFISGRYEGSDLILELRRAPIDPEAPEIIEAGAIPGLVQAAIVGVIGLGITFLIVKNVRVWCDGSGCGIQTEGSGTGLILIVALGAGLLFYLRAK